MVLSPNMKLFNHIPYAVASNKETNSTSIVDIAVKFCLALLQDAAPPTIIKIYSNIDLCESTQPVKSEFE
jgi:hypothetical protein